MTHRRPTSGPSKAVPWSSRLGILTAAVCLLISGVMTQPADAQNRRDRLDPDRFRNQEVDRSVTWLHWWEANRSNYIVQALAHQGRLQALPDTDRMNAAVEALVAATQLIEDEKASEQVALRAAAAMSLGRIGTDAAVDRLIELIQDDSAPVRRAAWMGLGASGHDHARDLLLEPNGLHLRDRIAWLAALGLLDRGDQQAIDLLVEELKNLISPLQQQVAMQSLRLLEPDELAAIGHMVVWRTDSVAVAAEAILAMGKRPEPAHADMVLSLLRGGPPAHDLNFSENGLTAPTCFAAASVLAGYDGMYEGQHRLRRILAEHVFTTSDDGFGDYYRGAALLAMAQLAEPEDEDVFTDALAGRTRAFNLEADQSQRDRRPMVRDFVRRDDPVRGYAAIAIGMYLQRIQPDGPADQNIAPVRYEHEIDRANRRLIQKLTQTINGGYEPDDLRAAAAIGLAFSGHPDALDILTHALEKVEPDNVMVIGYGTLAMAMLGDDRAVIPARRYFKRLAETKDDDEELADNPRETVLGMRAMALAMGLVGEGDAARALEAAWGADPWVSLDAAAALNWMGDDTIAKHLITTMADEPMLPDAAVAAMSLGELYDTARPSRMSRMLVGSNYTIDDLSQQRNLMDDRTENIRVGVSDRRVSCSSLFISTLEQRSYQALANVYLYEIMLEDRPSPIEP